jgi:hypothetical protein
VSVLLSDCHPALISRWERVAATFARRFAPWFLRVTRTLATTAEQAALFAQGREDLATVNALRKAVGLWPISPSENTYTVTPCDGIRVRSNHQGVLVGEVLKSTALDFVPAIDPDGPEGPMKVRVDWVDEGRFRSAGQIAMAEGLVWGGIWPGRKRDMPHVELPDELIERPPLAQRLA